MVVTTMNHSEEETQSRSHALIAVAAVMLFVTYLTVSLRLWVRGRMIHSLGWDDAHMCIALVAFSMNCISLFIVAANGGGTHLRDGAQLRRALTWSIINEVFYVLTHIFMKISLAILFLRLIIVKWQRYLVFIVIGLGTIVNIVSIFFVIFMCGNPRSYLDRVVTKKCVNSTVQIAMAYEQAGVTLMTDWVLAILPVFLLWNAKMDRRTKVSVGFILLLGTTGSVAAVARFPYIENIALVDDFFWNASNLAIWSTIELGTGITAGSLATLRPLFKRIAYHVNKSTRSGGGTFGSFGDRTGPSSAQIYGTNSRTRSQHGGWQGGAGNGIHQDIKDHRHGDMIVSVKEESHSRESSAASKNTDLERGTNRGSDQPILPKPPKTFQKGPHRTSLRKSYLKWDGFRTDHSAQTTTTCTGKLSKVDDREHQSSKGSQNHSRGRSITALWSGKNSKENLHEREARSGASSVELGHVPRTESRETIWPRVDGSGTQPKGLTTRWMEGDSDGEDRHGYDDAYRQETYGYGYDQRTDRNDYDRGYRYPTDPEPAQLIRKNSEKMLAGGISKVVDVEVTVENTRPRPSFDQERHPAVGRAF